MAAVGTPRVGEMRGDYLPLTPSLPEAEPRFRDQRSLEDERGGVRGTPSRA